MKNKIETIYGTTAKLLAIGVVVHVDFFLNTSQASFLFYLMRFICNLYDVDVFAVLWLQPHILRFQLLICRTPLLNSVVFVFVASCFFLFVTKYATY